MKKLVVVLVLGGLAILFFTNPSMDQFTNYMARESGDRFSNGSVLGQIGNVVSEELGTVEANIRGTRDDYLFFSVFRYRGATTSMQEVTYLGILNNFTQL